MTTPDDSDPQPGSHGDARGDGARDDSARDQGARDDGALDESAEDDGAQGQGAVGPGVSSGADRVYRAGAGMAGGVLLLALIGWLGVDALVRGQGGAPWLALAAMLLLVPLVSAFTLRPAVYANNDRVRVRNPFRTITLPWASVVAFRSGYSNEVVVRSGAKYQLWAIPVSLRARKKAGREQLRAAAAESRQGGSFGGSRSRSIAGAFGGNGAQGTGRPAGDGPVRAPSDRIMEDLRELAEMQEKAPDAQGEPEVKWCYEVMVPALAGLVLLTVLLAVG
jgi:hypothetical protein